MKNIPGSGVSQRWMEWRRTIDLDNYDKRWEAMALSGQGVHGEADFVERLVGHRKVTVLDAGCGTGRLAIEMTARGHQTVGIDLDPDMIERAQLKAKDLAWHVADLRVLQLDEKFEVIVMAGNIVLFCVPRTQAGIIQSLAKHLLPNGYLVSGFSLEKQGEIYTRNDYLRDASLAGLTMVGEYATWDNGATSDDDSYIVLVHQRS